MRLRTYTFQQQQQQQKVQANTGSSMCTRFSIVAPDLIIFSFVLPFVFYGDLDNFWRSILSQIFIEHVMRYNFAVSINRKLTCHANLHIFYS